MTKPAMYTVQSGDSRFSSAQHFYGDGNKWPLIYDYCNSQVIGQNPDLIRAGAVLYIPPLVQPLTCTVTATDRLNARAQPNTQSAIVHSFPKGTVLTFSEAPNIEIVLMQRSDPSLGAGEGSLPPTSAALANAFAHATGRRLRELPMTPERVKAALS